MDLVMLLLCIIFGTVFCAPFIRWIIIVPGYKFCALRNAAKDRAEKEERMADDMERARLQEQNHKEIERLQKKSKKFAKVHAQVEDNQAKEQAAQDLAQLPRKKKKKKKNTGKMSAADSYMAGLSSVANRTTDKVHFNDGILNGEKGNAKAKAEAIQKEIAERAARNRKGDFHS